MSENRTEFTASSQLRLLVLGDGRVERSLAQDLDGPLAHGRVAILERGQPFVDRLALDRGGPGLLRLLLRIVLLVGSCLSCRGLQLVERHSRRSATPMATPINADGAVPAMVERLGPAQGFLRLAGLGLVVGDRPVGVGLLGVVRDPLGDGRASAGEVARLGLGRRRPPR